MMNPLTGLSGVGIMSGVNPYYNRPKTEDLYNHVDFNKDGSLDRSEMQGMVNRLTERSGRHVDGGKLFALMDSNRDSLIDLEEFRKGTDKLKELGLKGAGGPFGAAGLQEPGQTEFDKLIEHILLMEQDKTEQFNTASFTPTSSNSGTTLFTGISTSLLENYRNHLDAFMSSQSPLDILA